MSRIGIGIFLFLALLDGNEGEDWEEGGDGEAHRSGGNRRRECRAAAGVLLGHFPQVACRGRLRSAGNGRWSAGMSRSASST
jgi:hypothetical protein